MIAGANVIRMDGKAFQPLKKGFAKDQLLKLPRLDIEHHQVFLVDENKEHRIDSEERDRTPERDGVPDNNGLRIQEKTIKVDS